MIGPKISILMPVYRVELSWLDESIESILSQTYENFEFVIVNDGAPQDVTKRLREWKDRDSRIVLLEQENKGCHGALNAGLELAKNDLVARMDSDDVALPNRIEKQVEYMLKNPQTEILNTAKYIYQEPNTTYSCLSHKEAYWFALFGFCCVNHPTVMFKRSTILKLGGYDEDMLYAEDYALWCKAAQNHVDFRGLDIPLLRYRDKEGDHTEYFRIQTETADRAQANYLRFVLERLNLIDVGQELSFGNLCCLFLVNFLRIWRSYVTSDNKKELLSVARLALRRLYGTYKRVNKDSVWKKIQVFFVYQKLKFILRLMRKGLL